MMRLSSTSGHTHGFITIKETKLFALPNLSSLIFILCCCFNILHTVLLVLVLLLNVNESNG